MFMGKIVSKINCPFKPITIKLMFTSIKQDQTIYALSSGVNSAISVTSFNNLDCKSQRKQRFQSTLPALC